MFSYIFKTVLALSAIPLTFKEAYQKRKWPVFVTWLQGFVLVLSGSRFRNSTECKRFLFQVIFQLDPVYNLV